MTAPIPRYWCATFCSHEAFFGHKCAGVFRDRGIEDAPSEYSSDQGMDALGGAPDPEAELSSARATAIDKAVLDGRLSPAARDMTPSDVVYQYAETAHNGNEVATLTDLGIPAIAIHRKRWTPCAPDDHEDFDDARACEGGDHNEADGETRTELVFPDNIEEAVGAIRDMGTDFAASGGDWAANPDGSTIINYATGEREEVSAHLIAMTDDQAIAIEEEVG